MKKRIKDYIQLPSQAVQLMIDGLREQSKRPDFEINMSIYGGSRLTRDGIICFGCAATCAMQKMTGINFGPASIVNFQNRSEAVNIPSLEVRDFEVSIDALRGGYMYDFTKQISEVLDIDSDFPEPETLWHLSSENWESELPKVEAYVKLLQSHGL